jgi:N-acyl-L-homoserine lactone synthetase
MSYRVYSGPTGSERISPIDKPRMLYKEFGILDEALAWSNHVKESSRVVLLIEGDDGTHLDRSDIAKELHRFAGEHIRHAG